MEILVIGAAGRTGRRVVDEAIRRGHGVTAFTRKPGALDGIAGLRGVASGDARKIDDLRAAVRGKDAVISIVAGDDLGPTTLTRDVTRQLVAAMREEGVRRLVVTSSRSIVATRPRWAITLAWAVFLFPYVDLARAETIVEESELDWTIVRATRLDDGPALGAVHIDFERDATGGTAHLSRADYARTLVDVVEDAAMARRAVGVCGPERRALPRVA